MTTVTLPNAAALRDLRAAVAFALDHLAEFDLSQFLRDALAGRDMQPWLDVATADRQLAADIKSCAHATGIELVA